MAHTCDNRRDLRVGRAWVWSSREDRNEMKLVVSLGDQVETVSIECGRRSGEQVKDPLWPSDIGGNSRGRSRCSSTRAGVRK